MKTEKIHLSHQTLLTKTFEELNLNLAEYNFSNLYLFRHLHQYELVFAEKIFLKGITRDNFSFLMPMFPLSSIDPQSLISLISQVDFLFPIPENWISYFDPHSFIFSFKEEDSDYLYSTEKLKTYKGRHLDSKRNFVKQFLNLYTSQTFILTADRIKDALHVLDSWQQEQETPPELTDYFPCQEALSLLEQLELTGYIIYVNYQPIAFVVGQRLNSDTYLGHFIKAKRNFKGVYPYLYQLMAKTLEPSMEFINLEQDLGFLNLRKSKLSYQPDQILKKIRIFYKK